MVLPLVGMRDKDSILDMGTTTAVLGSMRPFDPPVVHKNI